ncbi:MAG TPA: TolC family outer membrane protein, partial [Devosiaceae bacterium]|nr:TolC family outer membrane protein [Devosiaceae bacterium]
DIAARRAGKRPTVSASASTGYSWTVAGGTTTDTGSGSLSLSYNQRLFDNLRTDAQIDQARAFADVASQGLRNAEQNVLLSAATAYVDVVRDTELTSLRSDNVSFLQAQVQSAQDRLSIGEGTRIDLSQAEARLAQAVASYRSAVNSLQASRASYARWVGHAPSGLSSGFAFGAMLPASLDAALYAADNNHPAILSAQAQVEAARYGTDAALRAFGPTLDLVGSISSSFSTTGTSPSAMGSVRLSLSIPLYSGGALGSSARRASLAQTQSELDALLTRNEVRESVIAAWSGVQTAIAQIESAQSAVGASQIALDGVIEERNVGQRTTLDVLNARAELTSAREALISAKASRLVAAFSLIAATGRLSAAELHLPVTIRSAAGYTNAVEDVWRELRTVDEVLN